MMHEYILCLRLDCRKFLRKISVPIWLNKDKVNGSTYISTSIHLHGVDAAAASLQLWTTLCEPRDVSLPDSPVPGILQARTLEWVAISFSNA